MGTKPMWGLLFMIFTMNPLHSLTTFQRKTVNGQRRDIKVAEVLSAEMAIKIQDGSESVISKF